MTSIFFVPDFNFRLPYFLWLDLVYDFIFSSKHLCVKTFLYFLLLPNITNLVKGNHLRVETLCQLIHGKQPLVEFLDFFSERIYFGNRITIPVFVDLDWVDLIAANIVLFYIGTQRNQLLFFFGLNSIQIEIPQHVFVTLLGLLTFFARSRVWRLFHFRLSGALGFR